MRVLIIGAGGHGQVVADILLRMRERTGNVEPIGYIDDNSSLFGKKLLGLPVLGSIADLAIIAHDAVVVAIGDNAVRHKLYEQLRMQGERFITACHPEAVIASDVIIGPGTMVCAGVVVNTCTEIGANVILNTGCSVDHHNRIGNHTHIAPGARLGGEVVVSEGTLVGIGATVINRRCIGAWSIIGAGSVVNHDIPDRVVAVGNPARIVRKLNNE